MPAKCLKVKIRVSKAKRAILLVPEAVGKRNKLPVGASLSTDKPRIGH